MNRVILTPAALPGSALAELKQWLGVTTARDDSILSSLIKAALSVCEAFTGRLPLESAMEERLTADAGWLTLSTRPVLSIDSVSRLDADGLRQPLPASSYEVDLASDGSGRIRLFNPSFGKPILVSFTAGLASAWDDLPDGLRHGVLRLAAHQHRERDTSGAAPLPPAAVAALWRPWRLMRLL